MNETEEMVGTVPIEADAALSPQNAAAEKQTKTKEKCVCPHCGKEILEGDDVFIVSGEDNVCRECVVNHAAKCHDCEEYFWRDDMNYMDCVDDYVCDSCRDENYVRCIRCNEWIHIDDSYSTQDDERVCKCCRDKFYVYCEDCDNLIEQIDAYRTSSGRWICESCYESDYFTCESCGEIFHIDDRNQDDNGYLYCNSCWNEREESTEGVMSYHGFLRCDYCARFSINDPYASRFKEPVFGIELECDKGHFGYEAFSRWTDDYNLVHFEHDGSLSDDGVECITQPCSLIFHQRDFDWKTLLGKLIAQGFVSHNCTRCGLHVHISRAALSPSTVVKLDVFVNHAKKFFEQVARRDSSGYAKYDENKRADIEKARGETYDDRYVAVNTSTNNGGKTVELRIFRGTLKENTLVGTIEMCHALVKFLEYVPISRIYRTEENVLKFVDWCGERADAYPHLMSMFSQLVTTGPAVPNITKWMNKIEKKGKKEERHVRNRV